MPLIFILAISGREDRIANSRVFQTVTGKGLLQSMKSGNIIVGDMIRIEEGQELPADLILLQTSKHDSTCYVNTANLDAEITHVSCQSGRSSSTNIMQSSISHDNENVTFQ